MSPVVRIGLLHSLTGTMALSEGPLLDIERIALDEINSGGGVLGRRVEPMVADGASEPDVFARKAAELLAAGAEALFGCWTSSSRKAVKPVVEQAGVLLFYPVQYEGLEESGCIVYTGACLNQQITPAVQWALSRFAPRLFLVGSDYVFPRVAHQLVGSLARAAGATVAGERYLPLGEQDFDETVDEIRRAGPLFVFNTLNGDSNLGFFRRLRSAGLSPALVPVLSVSAAEPELQGAAEAAAGHFACWSYFQSLDDPQNRRLLSALHSRYGPDRVCSATMVAAWAQLFLWKRAVEAAGSFDAARVVSHLPGCEVDTPAGRMVAFANHHVSMRARVGELRADGQFSVVWESPGPIAPLPWLGVETSGLPHRELIQDAMASYPETLHRDWTLQRWLERRVRERTAELEDANHRLRAARDFSDQLIETANAIVVRLDGAGRVVAFNRAAERVTGYRRAEVLGRSWFETLAPRERSPGAWELFQRLEAGGAPESMEDRLVTRSGEERLIAWESGAVREAGRLVGTISFGLDITERRHSEEALRESREKLSKIFSGAPEAIALFRVVDRVLVDLNPAFEEFTGWTRAQALGRTGLQLNLWADHRRQQEVVDRTLRTGESRGAEATIVRRDGAVREALISTRLLDLGGERHMLWLVQDITERKRMEEALREASRRKDEFLSMLSHELRNPLAPIRNATHLLRLLLPAEPRVQRAREIIERQLGQLTRLLDDLLDTARITRGTFELHRERVDLRESADLAVEGVRPLLEGREGDLVYLRPDAPLWVDGDRARLTQVLGNLLNNSAKYSRAGQRIELALGAQAGPPAAVAWAVVRDEGQGIDPDLLPHVFELFVQGDRSLARTRGGLGIGLTLAHRLTEMHGGRIGARSEGPGRGSEFTVTLPLAAPAARDAPAAAEGPRAGGERALRVLVVDDNADEAESLAEVVRLQGHQAQTATDGPRALVAARAFHPELVLLDIGLPNMDGYEVARRMRAGPGRAPRLVAVTGYGREEDRLRARAAGFEEHLTKPVEPSALQRALERSRAPPAAVQVESRR
ncbi:MAG TPA: transporter substrate-binding protein [Myxococcales bacterium]